jgi:hypothetical protein
MRASKMPEKRSWGPLSKKGTLPLLSGNGLSEAKVYSDRGDFVEKVLK